MDSRTGVLFVCMGNICRSPIAEGVFLHLARERGVADRFHVASAGTGGWHIGNPPDTRARAVARRHGIELTSKAQQVDPHRHFDPARGGYHWLIGMDRENVARLLELGAPSDRVRLLRSFDPGLAGGSDSLLDVPDPYYGHDSGFDEVFAMVASACGGLLDQLAGAPRNPACRGGSSGEKPLEIAVKGTHDPRT